MPRTDDIFLKKKKKCTRYFHGFLALKDFTDYHFLGRSFFVLIHYHLSTITDPDLPYLNNKLPRTGPNWNSVRIGVVTINIYLALMVFSSGWRR